jgi:hypothetical protein
LYLLPQPKSGKKIFPLAPKKGARLDHPIGYASEKIGLFLPEIAEDITTEKTFPRTEFHDSEVGTPSHESPHLMYLLGNHPSEHGMNTRTRVIVTPLPDFLPMRAIVSVARVIEAKVHKFPKGYPPRPSYSVEDRPLQSPIVPLVLGFHALLNRPESQYSQSQSLWDHDDIGISHGKFLSILT